MCRKPRASARRSRRLARVAVVAALGFGLVACSSVKEQLGLTRKGPDEFTVVTKAPLVLPPDFTLRPPQAGAQARGERAAKEQAREALIGAGRKSSAQGAAGSDAESKGEMALLSRAGAGDAGSDIRALIDKETSLYAEKNKSFIDALIFWREVEEPATVVDAAKERRRLQGNAAIGKPANEGEVPVITYRKRGILEGIF